MKKGIFVQECATRTGNMVSVVGPRLIDGRFIIYDKLTMYGILVDNVEEVVQYLETN